MASAIHHVDAILRIAHASSPPLGVDANTSLIHRSWRRCANEHELDPALRPDVRIETQSRLRECRQQREDYLHVARAGMEQLYKRVSALGYVLLLTDAEGVTIDYIGNGTWDASLKRAGLSLGANWNEVHAGTNGIGTCIAERATLTCHRDEHFYLGHVGLSCTSTPLFDPQGVFMGALDVSALSSPHGRDSQHLALHLTVLYARMIEDANFLRQFRDRWILRLGTAGPLVDVSGEILLAFDRDGVIVGANGDARRQLRLLETAHRDAAERGQIVGSHLSGVFGTPMDEIWRMTQGARRDGRSVVTTWDGASFDASMIPPKSAPLRHSATPAEPASAARTDALAALGGGDERMSQLLERAARLVDKPVSVLIQGETGTGKEVLARALHDCSRRAAKAFVAVNCAAIPESLIESELFGYTPGTFTGARSKGMKGLIQNSDGGTLFLDEIGDMPLLLQTRLLRVLSEREIRPLGADKPVQVDLNVIAASHRDLRRQIVAGTFREDLYYRLCGATLNLPALRERSDKDFLIDRLLRLEAGTLGVEPTIDAAARAALARHTWPGNVRELRNALRFALSIADGEPVSLQHLPQDVIDGGDGGATLAAVLPFPQPVQPATFEASASMGEEQRLRETLRRHRWNITDAARELGLCRATIYRRLKRYGIVSPLDAN
jgi:sigma-54 dependent transcriptional regulator, acetoin dehydrogenase operon transcriptional activator AcoR